MDILQFTALVPDGWAPPLPDYPADATTLTAILMDQGLGTINDLACLGLSADAVTEPLTMDVWRQKVSDPSVWWLDYGAIYETALTDQGRSMADRLFDPMIGPLVNRPLNAFVPFALMRATSSDPVADGYIAAPEEVP